MRNILLLATLLFGYLAPSAFASEDFYTKYEVDYVFDQQGKATVNQQISLTNKKSGIYASSYRMTLTGDKPGSITGYDSGGPLKITTETQGEETTLVKIDFNDQVVGINQTLKFNLEFFGRQAAHNGQVWEISLPRLSSGSEIDEYLLRLSVPEAFGQLAFISPSPASSIGHQYIFTKDQISKAGVVAAFGNFQTFDFSLDFELTNPNSRAAEASVAIPADTNYQRVSYTDINPRPTDITVDAEGNWLATFNLVPKQNLTVKATGQAHLLAEPTQTRPGLTAVARQQYLQSTPYWPSDNPQIKDLASKLKSAKNIYNYVVNTLKYDYDRAKPGVLRKGAVEALATPDSSICTEFTDLFIAIARAAGIPTREVNGFAYTTDKRLRPLSLVADVFHAWPQYWDEGRQAWISVDPTWGKTTGGVDYFNKLDFNHFAFITRGWSDTTPAITSQNVDVKYGTYTEFANVNPEVSWQPPRFIWPIVANRSTLTVTNPLGQAVYRLPVTVQTFNIASSHLGPTEIDVLPPFSSRNYTVALFSSFWPNFRPKSLSLTVSSDTQAYNIGARLFLPWQIILGTLAALLITALAWLTAKAWGVYLHRQDRNLPVRGQGQKLTS